MDVLSLAIIGVALVLLVVLARIVSRWPERDPARKKKRRREVVAPVETPFDVSSLTERFERRIRALESSIRDSREAQKEKARECDELGAVIRGLERELEQEKAWRQKEELSLVKEKKQEEDLRSEVGRVNAALHAEANQRIRFEYEVKELRLVKEALTADVRKVTGQNNDLERRWQDLVEEVRGLRAENVKLKIKKEADQWVAKDDFDKAQKQLGQVRQEVERLKARLPVELHDTGDAAEK
ncbi:MAG: hypothetical protein WCI27_01740 [Candidatus Omnitrophota bacterium]